MNSKIIGLIIVVIIVVGGFYILSSDSETVSTVVDNNEEGSSSDVSIGMPVPGFEGVADEMIVNDQNPEEMSYRGEVLTTGDSGIVLDFNREDYQEAISSDKLVVLYFYADWCPICRAEFPKMLNAFESVNPDEVIGFRVNYKDDFTDEYEEGLAREFGVAYQHTKVFVKDGERILKAPDSWDEARYISEINKAK